MQITGTSLGFSGSGTPLDELHPSAASCVITTDSEASLVSRASAVESIELRTYVFLDSLQPQLAADGCSSSSAVPLPLNPREVPVICTAPARRLEVRSAKEGACSRGGWCVGKRTLVWRSSWAFDR